MYFLQLSLGKIWRYLIKNGRRLDGSHSVADMRIVLNESWTMIINGCDGAQASNDKCLNRDRLAEKAELLD